MASGSQNMTTYNAKRIIGDTTAKDWVGALLHSGTGGKPSTGDGSDTWIFADDYGTAAAPWGIKHDQTNNDILFIGAGTTNVNIHLGSSKVTATTFDGNANTATKLSNTPNNTTTFLRGDNTWTNTLVNDLYLSGAKALYINSTGAIAHNGSNLWIGATATNSNVFVGNLYLNGGLDSNGKRNRAIYVSLGANADATTGTNYAIVHKDATGSSTNGIYVDSNGKTIAMSYSLSATINAASIKNTFAYYSGTNAISSYPRIRNIGSARYPIDIYLYNDSGNMVGEMWYDSGDATNVTKGQWNFMSESPNSTNNTGTTGKYEYFYLPNVDTGRTANASYAIRTSKSSAYNVDTATHLSSAPNNTTTFYRGDKTWTNTISNEFKIIRTTTDWKTGATLTFNTTMSNTTGYSYIASYQTPTATGYNESLVIVATGSCFIGGGEGAETIHQNVTTTTGTEDLFLCPDGSIQIYTGADSKTKRATIDSTPSFYPATTNTGNIGTSSYKWASVWGTQFNNWKLETVSSLNANDVRTSNGLWACAASITNAAMTNHSLLLGVSNVGTPFQIQIPDSSHLYIYKRWYSSNAWSAWSKISAGYADSAASATYLKDRKNSTASYLNYGDSGLAASAITWLCCWNGYEVRAISKAEMANAVDSAHKWVRLGGDTMTGQLYINYTQDVGLNQNGAFIIGTKGGENIGIDTNEIMARNNSAASTLYLNSEGGLVYIGSGGLEVTGDIKPGSGKRIGGSGGALYIGNSGNQSWVYVQDMASQASGTPWKIHQNGNAEFNGSVTIGTATASYITLTAANGNEGGEVYLAGAKSYGYFAAMDVYQNLWRVHSNGGQRFYVNLQSGAHSDYAEDRKAATYEPGRVYRETNECILVKTNKRLIPGCSVCSDTYGTSIPGDEDGVPFAVSGRALVYPEGDRNDYIAGQAVCSGPNGTISLMTREEIKEYPDCILGYVAGIPDPEEWNHPTVELDNRIWIRLA